MQRERGAVLTRKKILKEAEMSQTCTFNSKQDNVSNLKGRIFDTCEGENEGGCAFLHEIRNRREGGREELREEAREEGRKEGREGERKEEKREGRMEKFVCLPAKSDELHHPFNSPVTSRHTEREVLGCRQSQHCTRVWSRASSLQEERLTPPPAQCE